MHRWPLAWASILGLALVSTACPFSFDPAGGAIAFDAGIEPPSASPPRSSDTPDAATEVAPDGGSDVPEAPPNTATVDSGPPPVVEPAASKDAGFEDAAMPGPEDSGMPMPPPHHPHDAGALDAAPPPPPPAPPIDSGADAGCGGRDKHHGGGGGDGDGGDEGCGEGH